MTVLQKIDNIASNIGTLSSLLTTNKSSLVAAVNELNNKMAYRVVNASGSSKQVINEEWVYLGTNITVPPGCFAILYAFRAWNSGKPKAVCISTSNSSRSPIASSASDPGSALYYSSLTTVATVESGTYYLFSLAGAGVSTERMEAIIFPT